MLMGPGTHVLTVVDVVERQSVVAVGVNRPNAAPQLLTRLEALTEPRPVARSNPVPALKASVPVGASLEFSVSKTPYVAELAVLLQPGLVPTQVTELFPFMTSLNVQVEFGPPDADELQFKFNPVCFANNEYKT